MRSFQAAKCERTAARRRYRVLLVCSHPVQYAAPTFRLMAQDPRIEIQVAYCSLDGAESRVDPDFGIEVKWDVPLLEGYSWLAMANRSPIRRRGSFFNLVNPRVWSLVRSRRFDVVVLHTGYLCATFWIAMLAAKCSGVAVLFGTDAHNLVPRDHKVWKFWIKKLLWPALFRLADVVIVPSSAGKLMMSSLGVADDRVVLTPYCVNNDWWIERSRRVDRRAVRMRWGIPQDAIVVIFSAKLQPWKRPMDLLRAVSRLTSNAYLVFAGEGPLRPDLESEAKSSGVASRVNFLGFVNQSGLAETYAASDILVLPSDYEPFGVVVNEAMVCGCCPVVSDRVGARFDLVREGETGFVFPAGDIDALRSILQNLVNNRESLTRIRDAARERMREWSPSQNVETLLDAVERGVKRRSWPESSDGKQ